MVRDAREAVRVYSDVVCSREPRDGCCVSFALNCSVSGGELFDRIKSNGPYSERKARVAFRPIVEALAFIHRHGIVHRDMKPEVRFIGWSCHENGKHNTWPSISAALSRSVLNGQNLLIEKTDRDTDLKLADFGLSQRIGEGTCLKKVCGTWAYAAPEMVDPRRPGYSCPFDMWGFGVILFVSVAGYHPFDPQGGQEVSVIKQRALHAQWDFDDSVWESISGDCKDLISRLLRRDPRRRLSAEQVLRHPWIANAAPTSNPLVHRLPANSSQTAAAPVPVSGTNGAPAQRHSIAVAETRRGSVGGRIESMNASVQGTPATLAAPSRLRSRRRRYSHIVLSAADHRKLSSTERNGCGRSWSPRKSRRVDRSGGQDSRVAEGGRGRGTAPPVSLRLQLRDRLLHADSARSWSTPPSFPEDPCGLSTPRSPLAMNPLYRSQPTSREGDRGSREEEKETCSVRGRGVPGSSVGWNSLGKASRSQHATPRELTPRDRAVHKITQGNGIASQRNDVDPALGPSDYRQRGLQASTPVVTNAMATPIPAATYSSIPTGCATAAASNGVGHEALQDSDRRSRSVW